MSYQLSLKRKVQYQQYALTVMVSNRILFTKTRSYSMSPEIP